jgi:3-oxoacyl-[acyl-carrier protein] reductase
MSDRYQGFVSTPIGKLLVQNLGLPNPTPLERWSDGSPLVDGLVVLGGEGRLTEALPTTLDGLGIASATTLEDGVRAKALVFDATGITDTAGLVALQEFFTPLMRRLETCPRVVVRSAAAAPHSSCTSPLPPTVRSPRRSPSSSPPSRPTCRARWSASVLTAP